MNRQDIYDMVRDHLMNQGKRSEAPRNDVGFSCAYRGNDGAMCAVGCLIADEFYSSELEGSNIHCANVHRAVAKSLGVDESEVPEKFLYDLQNIHDNTDEESWPYALYDFAVFEGLRP